MSRSEIKLNQTNQETDCIAIPAHQAPPASYGIQKDAVKRAVVAMASVVDHWAQASLLTPAAQSWREGRRWVWRIHLFRHLLTLTQSSFISFFMDTVITPAGVITLLCPAPHLLSPIGVMLTGVRAVGNLNAFVSSSVGNLPLESKGLQWGKKKNNKNNKKAQGTLTSLKDFSFVYIHSFFLFPHYLGLGEQCGTGTSESGKAGTRMETYMLDQIPASSQDILTTSSNSVLGAAAICRLKTCVAYLDSEDLMAPCNCRWDRLKISANPVYVYTFLSGWKLLLFFFVGPFCFVFVTAGYLKNKTK